MAVRACAVLPTPIAVLPIGLLCLAKLLPTFPALSSHLCKRSALPAVKSRGNSGNWLRFFRRKGHKLPIDARDVDFSSSEEGLMSVSPLVTAAGKQKSAAQQLVPAPAAQAPGQQRCGTVCRPPAWESASVAQERAS